MSRSQYGLVHQTVDLLARTAAIKQNDFFWVAAHFFQDLSAFQEENEAITLSFHTGDGLWIYTHGNALCMLKPTKNHFRIILFKEVANKFKDRLRSAIAAKTTHSRFAQAKEDRHAWYWNARAEELKVILRFLQSIKKPRFQLTDSSGHSRHIPGTVRQVLLNEFRSNGRVCRGVAGRTKPHKLPKAAPWHVDHVFPFSQNPSNSFDNLQILCAKCNLAKGATAL